MHRTSTRNHRTAKKHFLFCSRVDICVLISKTLYMRRWFQVGGKIFLLDIEDGKKFPLRTITSQSFHSTTTTTFFLVWWSLYLVCTLFFGWKRCGAMCEKHQMEQAIKWLSTFADAISGCVMLFVKSLDWFYLQH